MIGVEAAEFGAANTCSLMLLALKLDAIGGKSLLSTLLAVEAAVKCLREVIVAGESDIVNWMGGVNVGYEIRVRYLDTDHYSVELSHVADKLRDRNPLDITLSWVPQQHDRR